MKKILLLFLINPLFLNAKEDMTLKNTVRFGITCAGAYLGYRLANKHYKQLIKHPAVSNVLVEVSTDTKKQHLVMCLSGGGIGAILGNLLGKLFI